MLPPHHELGGYGLQRSVSGCLIRYLKVEVLQNPNAETITQVAVGTDGGSQKNVEW